MNQGRIICSSVMVMVVIMLSFAQALAEPILIKLTLKTPRDYASANSLGVVAYHKFDGCVIAEFDKIRLGQLERFGLKYNIIDENAWSEKYFLVSSVEEQAKVNVEPYGKILLQAPKWHLIKSSQERAAELRKFGYSVIAIHHHPVPLKYEPPVVLPKTVMEYSTSLDSLLSLVSFDSLCAWDLRLQNFKTRYSYSDSIMKARDWLYDKLVSFGIDSVWLQHFNYNSHQWNVVATVPGTIRPDRVIVVGAHYDSFVFFRPGSDPYVWAPGADDNGTGTAATLEMARIIADHPLPVTVTFVNFAQEEQGIYGSDYFASFLHNQGTSLELMINSDMIGHSDDSDPDVEINSAPHDRPFTNVMMNMANTYTYLRPFYGGQSFGSDHASFFNWGFHAVSTFEGDYFAYVHTNYDVVHSINFDYLKEVVKMCLATAIVVGSSPSPVESLKAVNGRDGHTVYLKWSANIPADSVIYYNVYYDTISGSYSNQHQLNATRDTLISLKENTTYYITVSAVNTGGFESIANPEVSVEVFPVTMDQGLLLVDETYINGFSNMVDGDSVNAFYDRVLQDYTHVYVSHSCPNCYPQNQLHIKELLNYSPIIVHSEDNRGNRSLGAENDSTYSALIKYLDCGGKVIIEGRRNLSQGNDGEDTIREFHPGDISYDYLKVKSAYVPLWTPGDRSEEFIGAQSQVSGYPDLQVDSLRVTQCSDGLELLGRVPGVGYIDSLMAGEVIYAFHSAYDTSHSEGKAVAFRYLESDYQFVYFDFPLYFIQEAQACSLLHQALNDLGMSPTIVEEDEKSKAPLSFSLKQNFPNPFNSETVIEYFLPKESQVKITVYNLLGQRVKIILDQRESAGHKRVIWDGKNEKGEMLSSGIYFYRIEAGEFAQTNKMVLLK